MDYSLSDELLAISSIYGDDVLVAEPASASQSAETKPGSSSCILRVPHSSGVEVRLVFGAGYPGTEAPVAAGVVSSGDGHAPLGHGKRVLETVGRVVAQKYVPDQPVLFELIEALMDMQTELAGDLRPGEAAGEAGPPGPSTDESEGKAPEGVKGVSPPGPVVEWVASEAVTEKKSTFVAHACVVSGAVEAKQRVESLIASDKRFERATHNISAFRGRFEADAGRQLTFQDCDDDGEDAAGGRLLHLLELTGVENVLVVVSRWYGGIKLGPDRFRIINQVAREALVRGGWLKDGNEDTKRTKKGK